MCDPKRGNKTTSGMNFSGRPKDCRHGCGRDIPSAELFWGRYFVYLDIISVWIWVGWES